MGTQETNDLIDTSDPIETHIRRMIKELDNTSSFYDTNHANIRSWIGQLASPGKRHVLLTALELRIEELEMPMSHDVRRMQ